MISGQRVIKNKKTMMKRAITSATPLCFAALLLTAMENEGQPAPAINSTDFNSVEYFSDAPHQQEIKRWLSGAEAQSLPGGLLLLKQVKIETFSENGKLQLVAKAPQCIYDPINGIASSPGEVHMETGDGQLQIDGKGFLWRQSGGFLTISNQVQTVIDRTTALIQ